MAKIPDRVPLHQFLGSGQQSRSGTVSSVA